jgi:N utilization substance protein B
MGPRRAARELALQALYLLEVRGDEEGERSLVLFWKHFDQAPGAEAFARELVDGVRERRAELDALLVQCMENWKLDRLSRVDLSLLRLAAWELVGRPEIPASVTINEAVEIARRFGSEESAAFVNGVLDQAAKRVGKAGLRPAADAPEQG